MFAKIKPEYLFPIAKCQTLLAKCQTLLLRIYLSVVVQMVRSELYPFRSASHFPDSSMKGTNDKMLNSYLLCFNS